MSEFNLPQTVGAQDTPIELVDFRLEGEPMEDFKERREENQKMVDEYLAGRYIDKNQPSFRILTRLAQGKRTLLGLSRKERRYIKYIIGITDDKLKMFVFFKQGTHSVTAEDAVTNVEIGNRNYRWL